MPPYYNMPYGSAPVYCFPITEISVYILFLICIAHSLKNQKNNLVYLFGGVIFGLLLEFVDVYFLKGYTYGRFIIMLGYPPLDIPFWIGVGWGIIMYSSRLFTDNIGMSVAASAALDALLALNIDLTMDVSAYRLHMWDWGWSASNMDPLHSQWFGIPYDNYFGWLIVVFTYSYFSRLFVKLFYKRMRRRFWAQTFVAISAILLSEIILFSWFNYIKPWLASAFSVKSVQLFLCLFISIILIFLVGWWNRKNQNIYSGSFVTWIVPIWFHVYFFIWFLASGFARENKWMTFYAVTNLVIGIFIHRQYLKSENFLQIRT